MARIKYPKDFLSRTKLFKNLKEKNDADGPASPLIPFLTQHDIDLNADNSDTDEANQQNDQFETADLNGEDQTQERNILFNPVFSDLKDILQFLKKLYTGNAKELGLWGATVDEERIVYPPHFLKRTQLFRDVNKKHNSFPAGSSPLSSFLVQNEIDMAAHLAATTKAETAHELLQTGEDRRLEADRPAMEED